MSRSKNKNYLLGFVFSLKFFWIRYKILGYQFSILVNLQPYLVPVFRGNHQA